MCCKKVKKTKICDIYIDCTFTDIFLFRWYQLIQIVWRSKSKLNLRKLLYFVYEEPNSAITCTTKKSRKKFHGDSVDQEETTNIEFMECASKGKESSDFVNFNNMHRILKYVLPRSTYLKSFNASLYSNYRFTFASLMNLSRCCPFLTQIKFRGARLSSDAFSALEYFPHVRNIMLYPYVDSLPTKYVPYSPYVYESFKRAFEIWKNLETFKIVCDAKLIPLCEHLPPTVRGLHVLVKNGRSNDCWKELETFFRTHKLVSVGSRVKHSPSVFEQCFPNVEHLDITVDSSKVYNLSRLKRLRTLCLIGNCAFWSQCTNLLKTISSAENVEKLDIRVSFPQVFTGIVDKDFPMDAINIKYVVLDDCNMNADFIECLFRLTPRISKLRIKFCSKPTSQVRVALQMIAQQCKLLECLIMKGEWVPNIPADDIELIHLLISNMWLFGDQRPRDKPIRVFVNWTQGSEDLLLNLQNFYSLPITIKNVAKYW